MYAISRRSAAETTGHRTPAGGRMSSWNSDDCNRQRIAPFLAAMCGVALALSACSNREVAWLEDTPFSFMTPALTVADEARSEEPDTNIVLVGEQSPEDVLPAQEQLAKAVPRPRAKPAAPASTAKAGRGIRPAISHPSTAPTPGRNRLNPNKLVGLDEREVIRLLGQPERVRSKPPATVWSYTVDKCTLDVSFYLDLASERFRVLAYEVNSPRGSEEMKKVCLGRIQSALRTN